MKKLLLLIMSLVCVLSFSACNFGGNGSGSNGGNSGATEDVRDEQIVAVYNLYVANAESNGQEPLSYEEWLASIKGEKGDDGLSAYEIWLGNGYTGTEEDFLNWLKGEPNHTFGEWQLSNDAVNCQDKTYFRICSDCGEMQFRHGLASDHDWKVKTYASTCKIQGYDYRTCKICDEREITNYQPLLEHTWSIETVPSTCKEQGYDKKTCDVCDKEERINYQPLLEHDLKEECFTDKDYHWYECNNCDTLVDKEEHTLDENSICTGCEKEYTSTGIVYSVSEDGTYAIVTAYEGTGTRIIIDDEFEGKPVKVIGRDAFFNKDFIKSIIIPEGVEIVEDYSIGGCDNLNSVKLPSTLKEVGYYGFISVGLGYVDFAGTVDQWAQIDFEDPYANPIFMAKSFYINGVEVKEVNIANTTVIKNHAFSNCYSIESVTIGGNVKTIGEKAFNSCVNLKTLIIGDGVEEIAGLAFISCTNLESVSIGAGLNKISDWAFRSCDKLANFTVDEDNETFSSIDGNLYTKDGKTLLQYAAGKTDSEFVVPSGVTTIDYGAFHKCLNLTSVVISDTLTTIGVSAFNECSNLTSITIPTSVTKIDGYAFQDCTNLTTINYLGTEEQWAKITFVDNWDKYAGEFTINFIVDGEEVE